MAVTDIWEKIRWISSSMGKIGKHSFPYCKKPFRAWKQAIQLVQNFELKDNEEKWNYA